MRQKERKEQKKVFRCVKKEREKKRKRKRELWRFLSM